VRAALAMTMSLLMKSSSRPPCRRLYR